MRRSWTPSIVPAGDDQNIYVVVDDFGRRGRAYCETDVEAADLETTIADLMTGELARSVESIALTFELLSLVSSVGSAFWYEPLVMVELGYSSGIGDFPSSELLSNFSSDGS